MRKDPWAVARYKVDGKVESEATVYPMEAHKELSFYGRRYSSPNQDYTHTSFGVTNPGEVDASITVIRRDRHGNPVPTGTGELERKFTLPPKTQITRRVFDEEFGGELPWPDWEGRVDLISDQPILGVAFNVAHYGKFAAVPAIVGGARSAACTY
jgi:hypothetical protein